MTGFRRRAFLVFATSAAGLAACTPISQPGLDPATANPGLREDPLPQFTVQRHRYEYGADPSQWGELFLPDLAPHEQHAGVVVVIHGGYWRSQYGAELGVPLAQDLAEHGFAAWNLEYRRMGNGGGWPQTFLDVLTGVDKLRELSTLHSLDLGKVVALGHSAGGQLAVWAAGRGRLAGLGLAGPDDAELAHLASSPDAVHLTGVVSQSGVLNLAEAEKLNLSNGAVDNLLGGTSSDFPERHRFADPLAALPLAVPVYAVHGEDDTTVPTVMSTSYVDASQSGPVPATFVSVPGDHFALIDSAAEAYARCRELVASLLA